MSQDEVSLKVECMPGIKLTPHMLLAQCLADADALEDVIIFTIEKGTKEGEAGYLEMCHTGVTNGQRAVAALMLQRAVMQKIED